MTVQITFVTHMPCQVQVTEASFCVGPPKMFCSCFGLGFNVAETNSGNENLLGYILMNSYD